jgi:hypothetical protein
MLISEVLAYHANAVSFGHLTKHYSVEHALTCHEQANGMWF